MNSVEFQWIHNRQPVFYEIHFKEILESILKRIRLSGVKYYKILLKKTLTML